MKKIQGQAEWKINFHNLLYEYAVLLDQIGENEGAEAVRASLTRVRADKVRVVFAGGFNTGKSTLINAVLGRKQMHTGMTQKADRAEEIAYDKDGRIFFVDTPGLDPENLADMKLLSNADVTVYILNAGSLFTAEERYVAQRLYEKWLRGAVFFVVNWIDMIPAGEEESVRARMCQCLAGLFEEETGRPDKAFYGKRVFFTNGLLAECARTHSLLEVRQGRRKILVEAGPEDLECSGLPEFEWALKEYLASPAVGRECYWNSLNILKVAYGKAKSLMEEQRQLLEKEAGELTEEEYGLQQESLHLVSVFHKIEEICLQFFEEIRISAGASYDSFVRDIDNHWNAYFSVAKVDFGLKEEARIASLQIKYSSKQLLAQNHQLTEKEQWERDAEFQEITRCISLKIQEYIKNRSAEMESQIRLECEKILFAYEKRFEEACSNIVSVSLEEMDISDIICKVMEKNGIKTDAKTVKAAKPEQLLLSLALFQNTTMAYDSLFVEQTTQELIVDGIYRKLYGLCVTAAIGCMTGSFFIGLLAHGLYKMFRRYEKASDLGHHLLLESREGAVKALRDGRGVFMSQLEYEFENGFAGSRRLLLGTSEALIRLKKTQIEEIKKSMQELEIKKKIHFREEQTVLGRMWDICQELEGVLSSF